MKKISVHELRSRIKITQSSQTRQPGGGSIQAWAPYCECFAKVETVSGREMFKTGQMQTEFTHKITIRFRTEFPKDARVELSEGQWLHVQYAEDPGENGVWLVLTCSRIREKVV